MRSILILFIATALLMSGCQNKNKIRKEILTKANTDMVQLVDKMININSGGLGSLLVDRLVTPEKKQQIVEKYLLPNFRTFVEQTDDIDSLKMMNTDDSFRYKMVLKSTIGNASEDALKLLYDKVIEGGIKFNFN